MHSFYQSIKLSIIKVTVLKTINIHSFIIYGIVWSGTKYIGPEWKLIPFTIRMFKRPAAVLSKLLFKGYVLVDLGFGVRPLL